MHRRRRDADGNAYNLLFKIKALTDNREKTLAELAKIDELLDDLSRDPG